jgi:hypothetical protein
MVGRLIPDESIVYDFSHDEGGIGTDHAGRQRRENVLPPRRGAMVGANGIRVALVMH